MLDVSFLRHQWKFDQPAFFLALPQGLEISPATHFKTLLFESTVDFKLYFSEFGHHDTESLNDYNTDLF